MRILMIGGTSFFGKEIVDLALEAGHEVTVLSRGNAQPDFWDRVAHIQCDRDDSAAMATKLAGRRFDAVIDNIAFHGEHVVNTLAALKSQVDRYILTSTTAVYIGAGPFDQPLREEDARYDLPANPQLATFPKPTPAGMIGYASGKLAAEKALIEQALVEYTIIRPHIVVGPQDNSGRLQFYCQRLLDGRPLILTNGGVQSLQFVYSRDLARSYLRALESERAANQVFTLAGDKTCRLVDWVELLAEHLGARSNLVSIPEDVVVRAPFQYAENWVMKGTLTFDVSKAVRDLGFRPTPITAWTERCARWYLETAPAADSPGYADRDREVAFASHLKKSI